MLLVHYFCWATRCAGLVAAAAAGRRSNCCCPTPASAGWGTSPGPSAWWCCCSWGRGFAPWSRTAAPTSEGCADSPDPHSSTAKIYQCVKQSLCWDVRVILVILNLENEGKLWHKRKKLGKFLLIFFFNPRLGMKYFGFFFNSVLLLIMGNGLKYTSNLINYCEHLLHRYISFQFQAKFGKSVSLPLAHICNQFEDIDFRKKNQQHELLQFLDWHSWQLKYYLWKISTNLKFVIKLIKN